MPLLIKEKMLNKSSLSATKTVGNKGEKGFSLIELIIAMVIFLIVTGASYGLLQIAQRSRKTVNQQVPLTKNVRLALNLLGRDTYNAGFDYPLKFSVNLPDDRIATLLGITADADNNPDSIPPVIAGNNITVNTFATPNTTTDQVTFLFKDSTFNLVGVTVPTDKRISKPLTISAIGTTGINQVTIAAASGTTAACRVNDIYVVTGGSGSALVVATTLTAPDTVIFAAGDVLGFNQNGGTAPIRSLTPSYTMQKVTLVTYFVTADGILTRRVYANALPAQNWVDQPLVYGVEDFQIQYILVDGTVSNNPSAGAAVRQIRYTVTAKASDLNAAGQPYRVTMTSTFGTRNLGYDTN